jgi:ABC-type polysaccharide/polyol phosphate export permease
MSVFALAKLPQAGVFSELRKVGAFLRRDLLVAWSYRMAFVSDLLTLAAMTLTFYFVGRGFDQSTLPLIGGSRPTYMEYVAIGIGVSAFLTFALGRVALAIRGEQLMGTLESMLMTPTALPTIQLGSVMFDLFYIPIRTALFLLVTAVAFGLDFRASGILPAATVLIVFIPFVWGLGILLAALTLTFKRGANAIGLSALALGIFSGAYFPLALMPHWLATIAEENPIARAMSAIRNTILSDAGWSAIGPDLALLAPLSLVSLAVGLAAFRLALRRERRLGTLGIY